jgi:hypothetical protein
MGWDEPDEDQLRTQAEYRERVGVLQLVKRMTALEHTVAELARIVRLTAGTAVAG